MAEYAEDYIKDNGFTADLDQRRKEDDIKREEHRKKIKLEQALNYERYGKFNTIQVILQQIQAENILSIKLGNGKKTLIEQIDILKTRIKDQFDDDETAEMLLAEIPSVRTIQRWVTKEPWKDAVMSRVKNHDVFSNESKTDVFKHLLDLASSGNNVKAIELYMKLSGELKDAKSEDSVVKKFDSLKDSLHGNN